MLYKDRTFDNDSMALDGHSFDGCVFRNCSLTYSGGNVSLDATTFTDTQIELLGAAKNTEAFLAGLQGAAAEASGEGAYIKIGDAWFRRVERPPFAT